MSLGKAHYHPRERVNTHEITASKDMTGCFYLNIKHKYNKLTIRISSDLSIIRVCFASVYGFKSGYHIYYMSVLGYVLYTDACQDETVESFTTDVDTFENAVDEFSSAVDAFVESAGKLVDPYEEHEDATGEEGDNPDEWDM